MAYTTQHSGDISTTDYRVFSKKDGKFVSYFHDIPLYANEEKTVLNMIVEIPKGTNAKMEISLNEKGNPIKQDVKKGKLRFVHDIYPYTGYIWNYGALPQTWEMPTHKHPDTDAFGDCDPLDACEIGTAIGVRGGIKQVKPLGVLGMIDEGETDWKVIVIDVNDPRADEFNDISDVQRLLPGFTMATYEWFRTYKMPAGKPANVFAFDGEIKNKEYTLKVIAENYNFWKTVITGEIPAKAEKYDLEIQNLTEGPGKVNELTVDVKDLVSAENVAPAEFTPASTHVKAIVEKAQRALPHGTGELSTIVQALACASAKAATEGAEGAVSVLKEHNFAAVYSSASSDALFNKESGHYTLHFHSDKGIIVYGVYQKSTHHRIEFSAADEVTDLGFDLVAAAVAAEGNFTFTTKHGIHTVTAAGPQETAAAIPAVAGDSVLAVKAPLAFFQ